MLSLLDGPPLRLGTQGRNKTRGTHQQVLQEASWLGNLEVHASRDVTGLQTAQVQAHMTGKIIIHKLVKREQNKRIRQYVNKIKEYG